jgi:hypothetical protein
MAEEIKVVIDVKPLPQSSGKVMDGGDCGYCCIGGMFGTGSILAAYELVEDKMPEDGGWKNRESITSYRIKLFLEAMGHEYEEYNPDFDHYKTGLMTNQWNNHNWYHEFKNLIDAGKFLFASVRYDPAPPPPPRQYGEHDHVVLINGYREWYKPHPTVKGASSLQYEIRISCSASGDRWMDYQEFLYLHGCAACIVSSEKLPKRA